MLLRRPSTSLPLARASGNGLPPTTAAAFDFRVDVFSTLADIEDVWRLAGTRMASYVFQSYDWLTLWQATSDAAGRTQLLLVCVSDAAGRVLLLLPLGRRQLFGCRALVFLGEGVSDYYAPLIDPQFAASCSALDFVDLWQVILQHLPPVDLVWLIGMTDTIEGVQNPMVSLPHAVHTQNAYASALLDSFEAYLRAHRSNYFSDARRKARKLAALGTVSFEVVEAPDDALATTAMALAQKRRRYGLTSVSPSYEAFCRMMAVANVGEGRPHISRLWVGDVVVASHIGVIYKNRLYSLVPGYEAGRWAQYSVGRLLMVELVKWCISEGIGTFDLTAGDEGYKLFWADMRLGLFSCRYALTLKGHAAIAFVPIYDLAVKNVRVRTTVQRLKLRLSAAQRRSSRL